MRWSKAEPNEWEGGTSGVDNRKFLVAMRLGDTPVPIPNTMVKTQAADGTALETVWESRWLPEYTINLLHELVVTRAIVRSTILNVRNAR